MPQPNACSFACAECKNTINITHLVFDKNEMLLVGHCSHRKGEQVHFKLDQVIANLMGRILTPGGKMQ